MWNNAKRRGHSGKCKTSWKKAHYKCYASFALPINMGCYFCVSCMFFYIIFKVCHILEDGGIDQPDECALWKSVLVWANHDISTRRNSLDQLMTHVRYGSDKRDFGISTQDYISVWNCITLANQDLWNLDCNPAIFQRSYDFVPLVSLLLMLWFSV